MQLELRYGVSTVLSYVGGRYGHSAALSRKNGAAFPNGNINRRPIRSADGKIIVYNDFLVCKLDPHGIELDLVGTSFMWLEAV